MCWILSMSYYLYSFQGIFMYIDNQKYYGLLVNSENFRAERAHGDLYEIFDNREVGDGLCLWEIFHACLLYHFLGLELCSHINVYFVIDVGEEIRPPRVQALPQWSSLQGYWTGTGFSDLCLLWVRFSVTFNSYNFLSCFPFWIQIGPCLALQFFIVRYRLLIDFIIMWILPALPRCLLDARCDHHFLLASHWGDGILWQMVRRWTYGQGSIKLAAS